jgi:outer membrane lipoprotein-sorting protein
VFAEDLAPLFDTAGGYATEGTLNGTPVSLIFDTASTDVFEDAVVTNLPSALLTAAQAATAAAGQTLVVGATTYTVRSVNAEPPDGALVRLMLTRG